MLFALFFCSFSTSSTRFNLMFFCVFSKLFNLESFIVLPVAKWLRFKNLLTCSRHYDIFTKTRSRMTTATAFSRQNDAGSRVNNTQYWENLVLVVVLVLESKALKCWTKLVSMGAYRFTHDTSIFPKTTRPRCQSNLASSDLTSPTKLVVINRAVALSSKPPPLTWISWNAPETRLKISHFLPSCRQLLLDCGIGVSSSSPGSNDLSSDPVVSQHRVLLFCQLKSMLDIVENDLLK